MRVPVSSPHSNNNNQSPKHNPQTNNPSVNFHLGISSLGGYEPTSVLDLRHSPSPVSAEKPSKISAIPDVLSHSNHDPLEWEEEQVLHNLDWDSIMRDLGLHDDNVPNLKTSIPQLNANDPQISEYPHPQPFDATQLVHSDWDINLSEVYSSQNCYDHVTNDFHQSGNWNVGLDFIEELIRAADCFDTDELQLAQVILDQLAEKADVASRNNGNPVPPVLRITAVVPEEYAVETRLIRENLSQFAQELKIRFQVEFVPLRTFEMMSFNAVKFMDGEKTAVLLSPYILRRLSSQNNISGFLGNMRRVSPSVVVFVDGEGMGDAGTTSFRRNFVSGLEFFSIMLESLDAAVAASSDVVKKIETYLLRPKIQAAVEVAGRRIPPWREVFQGAGMRAVELSQFADFQAQCLLGKVQVRGFHVAKRQAEGTLTSKKRVAKYLEEKFGYRGENKAYELEPKACIEREKMGHKNPKPHIDSKTRNSKWK
ncbi:unnamed protein product [Malus baccata var. baccata]